MSNNVVEKASQSPTVHALARAGIATRGVLYILVALLTARLAAGDFDERADKDGALATVSAQPFGKVLLALLVVGFAGYALWRLCEAALGVGDDENGDSWLRRIRSLGKGALYAVICATSAHLLVGGTSDGGAREGDLTARVMGWPMGRWIVGAVGLGLMGAGVYQGYRGFTDKWREKLQTRKFTATERKIVHVLAVTGLGARMVVFGVIGWFVTRAAVRFDPNEAVGVDGALHRLAAAPHGPWVLSAVAIGLFAYGLYVFVEARYRRILDD